MRFYCSPRVFGQNLGRWGKRSELFIFALERTVYAIPSVFDMW